MEKRGLFNFTTSRFQFSTGDAPPRRAPRSRYRRHVSILYWRCVSSKLYDALAKAAVSILYWRCVPRVVPVACDPLRRFNSLLEMPYRHRHGGVLEARGGFQFSTGDACSGFTVRMPGSIFTFQFSTGDALFISASGTMTAARLFQFSTGDASKRAAWHPRALDAVRFQFSTGDAHHIQQKPRQK